MGINKNRDTGLTIVELLVVLATIGIILALAGSFSMKAAYRRSVDSVTTRVANTLQVTKLQAARNGVEFRTVFVESGNELQLITHRGDSNIDSTVWTTINNGILSVEVDHSVVISNLPSLFEFRPNGTATPSDNVLVVANPGTGTDRCGQVFVSTLGRIATIQGHWDGSACTQVSDE